MNYSEAEISLKIMSSKEFDSSFSYMGASVKLYQVYSHIPRKHLMTKGNTV